MSKDIYQKFLITSLILMSAIFACENDSMDKQRVTYRSCWSIVGSCLGIQDVQKKVEPTVVSVQPNTNPDVVLQQFIKDRVSLDGKIKAWITVEGTLHKIQFIEEIQPNTNWLNIFEIRGNSPGYKFKTIIDWRKIIFFSDDAATVP
jgi:hypothetical protein